MPSDKREPEWVHEALLGVQVGVWRLDVATGRVEMWNGVPGADIPSTGDREGLLQLVHPDDLPAVRAHLQAVLEGTQPGRPVEYRIGGEGGGYIWVETRSKVQGRGPDGAPKVLLGTVTECSERVEARHAMEAAKAALAMSESRFRAFVEHTPEAAWCYEPEPPLDVEAPVEAQFEAFLNARLVAGNQAYARMRGAEGIEALLGQPLATLSRASIETLRGLYGRLVEEGFALDEAKLTQLAPNGETRTVMASVRGSVVEGKLQRVWGIFADITEAAQTEELEKQLRHAHKMNSVGRLAGGVAHDFNNLLLTVLGNADLALADLESDPVAATYAIDQIRVAAERGSKLTRRLLTFASRQELQKSSIRLDAILADVVPMLRRLIPESISLEVGALPSGHVLADAGQLEQVIMNLVINARDAIDGAGKIRIEGRKEEVDEDAVLAFPWAEPGPYVVLRVQDDGSGISEEARERIFEPFFSTKPQGSGTGLGLSIVYGVVQRHEGFVMVQTAESEGTTFDIFLPAREGQPASQDLAEGPVKIRGGHEVVLLAEDESSVGNLACSILERAGYEVIFAKNGREAVSRFLEAPERINLVVLDVVMPGLSGEQVFNEIRPRRPDLPVIFSSGYSAGVIEPELLAQPDCYALGKPYDRAQLLTTVRAALDRCSGGARKAP